MAAGLFGQHPGVSFGRELRRQSQAWAGDLMAAETNRQVNNARAELIRQSDQLAAQMQKNSANPSQWLTDFDARQEQIQTAILGQTSLPGAERYVRDMLAKRMAKLRATIRKRADTQMAKNADTDFNIGLDQYNDTSNIRDVSDLLRNLEAGLSHIAGGWNNGQSPVDSLPTEAVKNATEKLLKQKMVGDFLVRQATETGNMALIENANAIAKDELDIEEDLFTPKEIDTLKQRVRQMEQIADGQKMERAAAFDKDIRIKILRGGPLLPQWREEILNNSDISGAQLNTLVNLYDSRVKGAAREYTNQEKLAAYAEVIEEKDPEKKLALLFEHAEAFTPEKAQNLYDSIANPTAKDFEDSDVAKDLKALVNTLDVGDTEKYVLTSKGYGLLTEAIDSAGEKKALDLTQKKMKVLEIFNMLQKEAFELPLGEIPPEAILTPKQKAKGAGIRMALGAGAAMLVQGQLARADKTGEIPQPKTQAEFDALPTGTQYRRLDGTVWVKR